MNGYPQIIFMGRFIKKFLLSFLIIFILAIFFLFLGSNHLTHYLASFYSSILTATVTINPLEVDISAPAEVEVNKVFKVEAKIINKGEVKIGNARGEIFLPEGLILLRKDSAQEIGVILGKKEKKISWSARGKAVGNYFVSVKISGELKGDLISAEDSTMVEVKEIEKETGPKRLFQNFLDFFQERFKF